MKKTLGFVVGILAAIIVSHLALEHLRAYFLWVTIAAAWFVLLIAAAIFSRRDLLKMIWLNLSVVVLVFGLYESLLWTEQGNLLKARVSKSACLP